MQYRNCIELSVSVLFETLCVTRLMFLLVHSAPPPHALAVSFLPACSHAPFALMHCV